MTDTPRELLRLVPASPVVRRPVANHLAPDAELLLSMAGRLGPRDLVVLSNIIRRTAEICETDGEETALAVLGQIEAILQNRPADA
jgi:hypothetical protein